MEQFLEPGVKTTIGTFFVCLSATVMIAEQAFAGQPAKGNLIVTVSGINSDQGTIKIGLYNKQAGFMDVKHVLHGLNKPAKKGSVTGKFNDLPFGGYAISVLHDENNNGRMDKNFFGMPKEGYAFSRNVRPRLSAPSFKQTRIQMNGESKSIQIKMRY